MNILKQVQAEMATWPAWKRQAVKDAIDPQPFCREPRKPVMTQQQIENMREHDFRSMVAALAKPGYQIKESLTTSQCHLLHMVLGISGEAGELLDAIKKHTIYGKDLDLDNVQGEAGDILFYLEGLLQPLGITLDHCRQATMDKLAKRYPGATYSNQAAIERADKCVAG